MRARKAVPEIKNFHDRVLSTRSSTIRASVQQTAKTAAKIRNRGLTTVVGSEFISSTFLQPTSASPGAKPAPEFITVLPAAPGFAYAVKAVVRSVLFLWCFINSLPAIWQF